jgi:membrane protein YdbS with pleckstrin-like domain
MTPDPARARFMIISLTRVLGVILVVCGILVVRDAVALPHAAGWALLAVGLVDVFVVPQVLARRWRTPPR